MSLEDLMNVQVTSVSKKEQTLSRTGAAAYVITQEDIRRSGMTNLPDLLRLAPGVNVARVTANTWAVSIRGFNDRYSNKVLVLIDGRSVYTPGFSGVFWDQQSVPLEDIDRIEIIRGPGGTVWGANAVNGVINIITKRARDTQGGLVSLGTGSRDSARGLIRYGGKAGSKGFYRVFGQYFNVEKSVTAGGGPAADGWHGSQGGFRAEWDLSARDSLNVQGDLFETGEGQTLTTVLPHESFRTATFNDRVKVRSGNLLGRWTHTFAGGSETSVQAYYSRVRRLDQGRSDDSTADVDLQHRFAPSPRHDFVVGAAYRYSRLAFRATSSFGFYPSPLTASLYSTFVQDEMKLTPTLSLTMGSKFEHNAFTGFEFEPGAQLVWAPDTRRTLWFSAARAIRQPSWLESNSRIDAATFPLEGGGFGLFQILGKPGRRAERLMHFEAGYRTQIHKRLSLDGTVFRSYYHRLETLETETPFFTLDPPPPHLVLPAIWDNRARARNHGVEVFATWSVTGKWRISPGYSFLHMRIRRDPGSNDDAVESSVGHSPRRQAQLRSSLNLARHWEWDVAAYYVGQLRNGPVPGYVRLDTRLGRRLGEFLEVSIAGQNLLAPRRLEFVNAYQLHPTQAQRSILGRVTWRF
jgi:iron complex outermembrane receptor protein